MTLPATPIVGQWASGLGKLGRRHMIRTESAEALVSGGLLLQQDADDIIAAADETDIP